MPKGVSLTPEATKAKRSASQMGKTRPHNYTYHLVTHGMSLSPTHKTWKSMRARAGRQIGYEKITVDPRWDSFESFLADMGVRPEGMNGQRAAYSIDRINNHGNYTPDNCRWATRTEQARNRG